MAGQSDKDTARQLRIGGSQVQVLARNREVRVGRRHRVDALAKRMPFTMVTIPDPLITDSIQDDEPNDALAVTNYLWNEYLNDRARLFGCELSRRGTPARSGGREPSDEPHAIVNAIIPGGIPAEVKITDIALFLEEPEQRIYTIIDINTDRLEYVSRLALEEFGHRSSNISGAGG